MQTARGTHASRPGIGRPAGGGVAEGADLAIRAAHLTKLYRHPWTLKVTRGVEDLSLELPRGEVLGYLGPNGAGKTTTLKLLAGLLKPTSGSAWLLGESIERPASRRRLGFLPEQPYFYDYLNGIEYLVMAARLSGLTAREAGDKARHWMGRVGLGDRPKTALRKYSKGMLQRLGLAAALVHGPELLILDEPMSGLDPFGRRDVRDLILEQKQRGVTVLFSSHILPDVELLCDRVAIVSGGRLARVATVLDLLRGGAHRVEIACGPGAVIEIPAAWSAWLHREERAEGSLFVLEGEEHVGEVLEWLLKARVEVRSVIPQRLSLESLFLSATQSRAEDDPAERRLA
jgi:ABC-2 type transport system ATP-binding protein